MKKSFIAISCICANVLFADNTFTLGEINIISAKDNVLETNKITEEVLENEGAKDITTILDKTAGLTMISRGGRAEKAISIRGSNSSRTGVFLDGIPIYVPFDGQFDYSRILTTELSSIDVSKGFSSSAYGPNTSAGVVNLISKKPQKAFEGSITTQMNFDNDGNKSATTNTLNLGSKQEKYYVQFSGTYDDRSHWNVSDDFTPTSSQANGARNNSSNEEKSGSLKVGLTPNDSSEYVLGYMYLDSEKEQPVVTDSSLNNEKFWTWPEWNKKTIYFISNNDVSTGKIKFKVYKDMYENISLDYADNTYTGTPTSYDYDDYTFGANLEYTYDRLEKHTIKTGINFKKDSHKGHEVKVNSKGKITYDSYDKYEDNIYSLYAEDTYSSNDKVTVVTSASYDYDKPSEVNTGGTDIARESNSAFNPEIGLYYDTVPGQTTRFTLSRKTNFPTMKERYSNKRGKGLRNPYLQPEEVTNFEVGHNIRMKNISLDTALFYTKIDDPITNVAITSSTSQEQNTGNEKYKGLEFSINYKQDRYDTGFNYTFISSQKEDNELVTEVPKHQASVYVNYRILEDLTASADYTYKYGIIQQNSSDEYVKLQTIDLVNLSVKYDYNNNLSFTVGSTNLFDENYEYDLGYPEDGREFFIKAKYTF